MRLHINIDIEKWPLKSPLRDNSGTLEDLDVIVVTIEQDAHAGRGEAAGVYYLGDDVPRMIQQIENARARIEAGVSRQELLTILPAGGARNAVDCALWELEAKQSGCAVWQLAGIAAPRPLLTTYTLGADEPAEMARRASAFGNARAIKLKLTGEPVDADRVRAVRAARQDVWLCVDANQGFTREFLQQLLPVLIDARVGLIEQPFRVGKEADLDDLRSPIPIAADETAQDVDDLPGLVGRFDAVNIKLDKCGGLTAALAMAHEARSLGLDVMIGNMTGTALAMAPAFLVGQLCTIVDLDGAIFLRGDRPEPVIYEAGTVWCAEAAWGGIASANVPTRSDRSRGGAR